MTAERIDVRHRGAQAVGYCQDGNAWAGYGHDGHTLVDLFGLAPSAGASEPHPDFTARARIWKDHAAGLISLAEAQRRSAAVGAVPCGVKVAKGMREAARPRHSRPAPNESRQYSGEMSTTAARDDRLTPNAKAFLQVLRARCGKGRRTEFAKATMGAVMARSARTIRRYLVDLERFGYVRTEIRRTLRGVHTGLLIELTEKALPFFEEAKGLAAWLAETPTALFRPFTGGVLLGKGRVTKLTPKNQTQIIPLRNDADASRIAARRRLLKEGG